MLFSDNVQFDLHLVNLLRHYMFSIKKDIRMKAWKIKESLGPEKTTIRQKQLISGELRISLRPRGVKLG